MDAGSPRANTLALQGLVNRIIRGLLRLPGISRLIGRRLIVLYVVGRTSGRRYSVPVAYTRLPDHLLVGTPFGWGRNLRTGTPVRIRLMGRLRQADVEVVTDEAGVVDCYRIMARDNRAFARFNNIGLAADGTPDDTDLHLAWAAGARAIRLRPT